MTVVCGETCCVANKGMECQREKISVCSDNYDSDNGFCDDFEDYTETADYQCEFWKVCKDRKTQEVYRIKAKGKKIEKYGFIFYTEHDDREGECRLTEERTGYSLCRLNELDKYLQNIIDEMPKLSDALSYPERDDDIN